MFETKKRLSGEEKKKENTNVYLLELYKNDEKFAKRYSFYV